MQEINSSVVKATSLNMIRTITEVGQSVLQDTFDKIDKESMLLMHDLEKRIIEVEGKKSVLMVEIKSGKKTKSAKLSQSAVPYLDRMIKNAALGFNTLLVGPAGCGKTTAAKQLSESLERQFGSVCLTAGASETWLFGRHTPTGFIEGTFSKIYREGGVFLADEMDAADSNLLLSINTALANGYMFNPMLGEEVKKHKDFVFVGAANTFGKGATHVYTGRSRLDAATLDRFIILEIGYSKKIETKLCSDRIIRDILWYTRKQLDKEGFDETLSSRAFDYCDKQYKVDVELKDIFESLCASWSPDAKSILLNCYRDKKHLFTENPEPSTENTEQDNSEEARLGRTRVTTNTTTGESTIVEF